MPLLAGENAMLQRALFLKGMAYAELQEFEAALVMLSQTSYGTTMLADRLIRAGIGLEQCRTILERARDQIRSGLRGVEGNADDLRRDLGEMRKIESLIGEIDSKSGGD